MQALLSEHWHAVRGMRPRLREGVQVLHRRLRGRAWVLLHDPVGARFHRVALPLWRVIERLDGRRTLDEVWNLACVQGAAPADAAERWTVSQHELVQLLATLHAQDLLQTQVAPDAAEVFERYRRQRGVRIKQAVMNPLSLKIPLLYPDAWFERLATVAQRLFTWPVLALWLVMVLPAAVLAWQHADALTDNLSDRVLSAHNLLLLWLVYPVVKAIHEVAHGLAVKAWGGDVREVGLMFLIFAPVPYVDASASYRFASKWVRATVAAAGILTELVLGALALYLWLAVEPGIVKAVAFNVVLIAGASTVLVNGNPLMRYDGYFIACDLLESPNLAQRATQYWTWLIDRYAFGARDAEPPLAVQGERALLFVYGAIAPVYRLSITVGLVWFVAGEYPVIGIVMAGFALWGALVMPLWKGWRHLRRSPGLARRRTQALWRATSAVLALLLLVFMLPLPFYSVHQAVVWLPEQAIVRSRVDGTLVQELHRAGEPVHRGDVLLRLENPELAAEHALAEQRLAHAATRLRLAEFDNPGLAAGLRAEWVGEQAQFDDLSRRLASREAVAAVDGIWQPHAATERVGMAVRQGEVLGYVVGGASPRLRCAVTQVDLDLILKRVTGSEVRLVQRPEVAVAAQIGTARSGGEQTLVSAALGTSGGGEIPVDPAEPAGTRSLGRVFDLELEMAQPSPAAVFGDRALVRFDLGWAPLGWQWFVRLRQAFLSRLNV